MILRVCRVFFIVSLCVFDMRALSQAPSSTLQGIVVEAGRESPIAKANVELRSASGSNLAIATTLSDNEGKFFFPNAAPGQYRVVVTHSGHVTAEYGQRQSAGAAALVTLAPGGRNDIKIAMTPAGVISGRILDKGQPIGQADAVLVKAIHTEGQISFTPVLAIRGDDLGEFHLFWIPPGRYYLMAVVWDIANSIPRFVTPDGNDNSAFYDQRYIGRAVFLRATGGGVIADNEAHIPIYYPGTPDPQLATAIDVRPGAVLRGMDIDAGAVQTRRVRGRIDGMPAPVATPPGQQPQRATVSMRPLIASLTTNPAQAPNAGADSGGNFEMTNVVPGRYMLTATAGNLTGRVLVEVRDRDIPNVVVALTPGFPVSGRVVIERAGAVSPDPSMTGLRIGLRTDPLLPGAAVYAVSPSPDGTFTIGVAPAAGPPVGEYRVLVTPILASPTPPESTPNPVPAQYQNLYVKSIRMGDVDVLNDRLRLNNQPQDPLTIVIGSNPGTLSGRVVDGGNQPVSAITVVLVHDNGLRYRVNEKTTSSDSAGQFDFQSVPPGNYKLFAWDSVERGAWQDPEFMRPFESQGIPVRIDEGVKISVTVKPLER